MYSALLKLTGSGRSTPQSRSRAPSVEDQETKKITFEQKMLLLEVALAEAGFMQSKGRFVVPENVIQTRDE